jgi:RNA methyltransferase, TrmH family
VRELQSASHPLVKRLRASVRDPALYRKSGELWLEGEHLLQAWVDAGCGVQCLVVAQSKAAHPLVMRLAEVAPDAVCLPDALFSSVSGLDSPGGMGLLVAAPAAQLPRKGVATVVLDRVQDPGNVGTVLRTAAAMGFAQVLALRGTVALWSAKVLRGGMGAHLALHLAEGLEPTALAALDVPLVATLPDAPEALWTASLPWPVAWVLGHEGQGVSPEVLALCQRSVRIPQPGGQESLNVAVATAMCLYESSRQRAL